MPGMDGFEVFKKAKELGIKSKIIALTGHHNDDVYDKISTTGFDQVLVKPILKKDIIEIVENG